jgi:hypothetical protein
MLLYRKRNNPGLHGSSTGRRDSLRFKASFLCTLVYTTRPPVSERRRLQTKNIQNEMENNQAAGRAATTKQDLTDGETKSAQN